MDKVRQWVALTVVGVLAVLAAGWVLLVQPIRNEAADLRGQTDVQVGANGQLEMQLAVLRARAEDLPKEQAKLAAVATRVPDNPAQPALLRALAAAALEADVEFVSVAPGGLTPVAAEAAVDPAAAAAPATGSAGTLLGMQLSIQVAGGYYETAQYVGLLEELPRALRISGLTLTPGANPVEAEQAAAGATTQDGRSLVTDITGTVFVASGVVPAAGTAALAAPVDDAASAAALPVGPDAN